LIPAGKYAVSIPMRTIADDYRSRAADCRQMAEKTRDTFLAKRWLEIAETYEAMAEQNDGRSVRKTTENH
jgi:hypothetical protein